MYGTPFLRLPPMRLYSASPNAEKYPKIMLAFLKLLAYTA